MNEDAPSGRDFGRLESRVEAMDSKFGRLTEKVEELSTRIDKLTHIAERGRGAYWAAGLMAAALGASASTLLGLFRGGGAP